MNHLNKTLENLKNYVEKSDLETEKKESREITNKLELKSVISPNKIFELFEKFLNVPNEKKTTLASILNLHTEFERRIINSILSSFKFDKKRHHKFPFNNFSKYPVLDNLSAVEINNIRAIIIIMQNENCFNNFNPLLASKIITNNFCSGEKNSNNSVANNRKILKEHFIKGSKNLSKYTPISSEVKLHKIKHNFK